MTTNKKPWNMVTVIAWAYNLIVNDAQAKFRACVRPNTKVLATKDCEWCGAKSKLFVFVSEDNNHYLGICKACRKHEVRVAKGSKPTPHHAQCHCGQDLPADRKVWCYDCRPRIRAPKAVTNPDGSGSIQGGFGM